MQCMWRGVSAALVASTDMSFVREAVQYCRVVQNWRLSVVLCGLKSK